jgi:hypothetical protein
MATHGPGVDALTWLSPFLIAVPNVTCVLLPYSAVAEDYIKSTVKVEYPSPSYVLLRE